MQIKLNHKTSQLLAKEKMDTFLAGLLQTELTGGFRIKNPQKRWAGNRMEFSFTVKKSWVPGINVEGTILVSETEVIMDCDLPGLITAFVNESEIREVITSQFNGLFSLS